MTDTSTINLIGPLTADEWCSLRLNADGDPLMCCGDTSEVRDAIFDTLRMGAAECDGIALRAAWHIVEEHGDLGDHPLMRKLYEFYVQGKPELAPDRALAEMMAVPVRDAELYVAAIPDAFDLSSDAGRITALGRIAPRIAHVLDYDERCRLTVLLAKAVQVETYQVTMVVDAWRGNVGLPVEPRTVGEVTGTGDQRNDARRMVEEARLEAAALLHMERRHGGSGRDGHLNEDDLAPLLTALQIKPADPPSTDEGPTWEDVWAAIGREVWKLAPQDYQDSGHRDLTFLTCWQNVMEAVHNGIVAVAALPDEAEKP